MFVSQVADGSMVDGMESALVRFIVGNLGFSEIAFPKPLFHGDTIYAESVVIDKRESKSRPGEGIVTFAHTARNQHGDIVATATRKTMVRKKPA